jgi:hypothetical protein
MLQQAELADSWCGSLEGVQIQNVDPKMNMPNLALYSLLVCYKFYLR